MRDTEKVSVVRLGWRCDMQRWFW